MSGVPLRPGWFSYNWLTGTGMSQQGGNTLSTYSGGVGAEPSGGAGTPITGNVTSGSSSGAAGAVAQVTQAVTDALSTPTGWLVIAAGVLVLMGGGKHVKH